MADPLGPPIWAPFNVVICFAKITSVLDIIKLVAAFAGGGLAGALANEYFRRRSNRLQPIPLIERVNRPLGPGHRGFTLARVVEVAGQDARLEPIRNLREYQLTLRNTSTIHLQNVEIQFEFPSEDVDAYASRPARSNTAPVVVDVRRDAAFDADDLMILGAIRRVPDAVDQWRRELPRGRAVVAYCAHGREVSQTAAAATRFMALYNCRC